MMYTRVGKINALKRFSIVIGLTLMLWLPLSQTSHAAGNTLENQIIASGMNYLGAPYKWGAATDQTSTFDCSSYTYRVFADNGITIPRTSYLQSKLGVEIPLSQAIDGDLVFFHSGQPGVVGHVGIYMGHMKMLSATVSKGTRVVDISTSYWLSRFITVKRVVPQMHMVTAQDSLWKLSRSTGNSIEQIKRWNSLSSDMILTGSSLFISNPNLIEAEKERSYHIVQPSDSLWTISQKYGLTIDQLLQWNTIKNIDIIYDGSRIYLES